jgi:hypothetical protein
MSTASLVGLVGTVCTTVRGGDRPGEVRVVVAGLPHYYLAYCATGLATGQQVLLINQRGPRMVDVEAWSPEQYGARDAYGIAQPQG